VDKTKDGERVDDQKGTSHTRISVKHKVGAATLLSYTISAVCHSLNTPTNLIHMLAKHETNINARSTVLGFDPAKCNTRVIRIRSMFVLLRAEEIVKPPINNMIVGENIIENTYLESMSLVRWLQEARHKLTWWQPGSRDALPPRPESP